MNGVQKEYVNFVKISKEIAYVQSAISLLEWDMETQMPPSASDARAQVIAHISQNILQKMMSKEYTYSLLALKEAIDYAELPNGQVGNVLQAITQYERMRAIPADLLLEITKTCASAHHVWARAKVTNDFNIFAPTLTRIVELARARGRILNPAHPYDACIQDFEPGMTSIEIEKIFTPLQVSLSDLVRRIQNSKIKINAHTHKFGATQDWQHQFCQKVATAIGFNFSRGRLDESAHPFSTCIHPDDLRITKTTNPNNVWEAVYSTIHEVGHAKYRSGLSTENFGLPAGSIFSSALDESQARLWEVMIGQGKPFSEFITKFACSPWFKKTNHEFYRSINAVCPGLRRVDSDEVTYNLHIILRFQIERELIEGRLEVKDIRDAWHELMREYLELDVLNDAYGVLQDVHWSAGLFGYFPSYTLGNIYAAEQYCKIQKDIPDCEKLISQGIYTHIDNWLQYNIWQYGSMYDASDIITWAIGKKPNAAIFIQYLEKKYGELYEL